MIAHARSELPNEACGIFGGRSRARCVRSIPRATPTRAPTATASTPTTSCASRSRSTRRGDEVAAIYHSHTMSPASPSRTDMELASWPEAAYLIVSLASDPPEIRAWRLIEGSPPEELPLEIT